MTRLVERKKGGMNEEREAGRKFRSKTRGKWRKKQ